MITTLKEVASSGDLVTDVCVIGSGAAGTTVALALADAGVHVTVLEAGGSRASSDDPLEGDLTGAPGHDPLERVRQRRLGGTTAQWGGRCVPFDDVDFERRHWVPESGWPFDRATLMPWYRRAGEVLQLGQDAWTAEEALCGAMPVFAGEQDVLTDDQVWRWSPPVRFWPHFRRRLTASSKVRVVQHAPVVRLEQALAGGPVTAAVVRGPEQREVRVRARSYVVATGGVETARLLLSSDSRSAGGIGAGGDALGRYYMIHPLAEVGSVQVSDGVDVRGLADFVRSRDGVWVRRMLRLSDATQRKHQLLNTGFALWYPDPRDPSHGDALLSTFALVRRALTRTGGFKATGMHRRYAESGPSREHLRNVVHGLPSVADYGRRWVRDRWVSDRMLPAFAVLPATGQYRLRFDAEQSPDRANRVVLSPERDSLGMRRVAVHHRVGRDDRLSLVRSLRLVAAGMERSGRARVVLPPEEQVLDELVFGDGTHQIGTARMSTTPRTGVVDEHCRVHECHNLHVAGSAVFPTAGMAGPTLTIVALALRLGDRLAREHGPYRLGVQR